MTQLVVLFKHDLYPYVRTTQKQKYVDREYALYHVAKKMTAAAVHNAMLEQGIAKFPKEPLRAAVFVNVPKDLHRRDADNVLKGVTDGAQYVAYANDAWFDQLAVERLLVPDKEQRGMLFVDTIRDGPAFFSEWLYRAESEVLKWGLFV